MIGLRILVVIVAATSAAAQGPASDNPAYLKKRAERIMDQLDYEFACKHLERAIGLHPADADFRMLLGEALFALERWGPAIAAFEAGIEREPAMKTRAPHYPLALVNEGRLDDARAVYTHMLENGRDDADRGQAEYGLGLVLYHRGEIDAAAEHLRRANELLPDSKKTLYRLALAQRVLGRLDEARANLLRVIELDGLHEPAIHNLAMIEIQRKDLAAARKWRDEHRRVRAALEDLDGLKRALADRRGNAELLRRIGDLLYSFRRYDDAIGPYSSLITQAPTDPEPRFLYAMCHFKAGRYHDARLHLQQVLRMNEDHEGARAAMAVIVERFGKQDE